MGLGFVLTVYYFEFCDDILQSALSFRNLKFDFNIFFVFGIIHIEFSSILFLVPNYTLRLCKDTFVSKCNQEVY